MAPLGRLSDTPFEVLTKSLYTVMGKSRMANHPTIPPFLAFLGLPSFFDHSVSWMA